MRAKASIWAAVLLASLCLLVAPRPGLAATPSAALALDPNEGEAIGLVYEAFLSPQQEPSDEKDAPPLVPSELRSTAPSVPRAERETRGRGQLRFTNDLSKAYVDVRADKVNPDDIVMFHLQCGQPDVMGPILIDFGLETDLPTAFAEGTFAATITNADIETVLAESDGLISGFTAGCSIDQGLAGKVKTIAGMQYLAERGELYFNLHTKAHTFFGEMRGQLRRLQ